MNEVYKQIKNSSIKQRITITISYIVNIVLISVLLMLSLGVSDIRNESLSNSDYKQMVAIISSIVSVSVVTIIFFQWIIAM